MSADQNSTKNDNLEAERERAADADDIIDALDEAVDSLIDWAADWHLPIVTGNRIGELGEQQRSILHLKPFQEWFESHQDNAVVNQKSLRTLYQISTVICEQASTISESGTHTTESKYRALMENVQKFITQARRVERAFAAASSDLDTLTGIQNRHAMRRALERRHDRSERTNVSATIALVDLDHFKKVNDTYGHSAGDQVLSVAAGRLLEGIRSYDQLFRYGGEEFLVLLDDADHETTRTILERLRRSLAETKISIDDRTEIAVTASFGAAELCKGESIERTIERADEALYRAKDGGRNRVEFARKA